MQTRIVDGSPRVALGDYNGDQTSKLTRDLGTRIVTCLAIIFYRESRSSQCLAILTVGDYVSFFYRVTRPTQVCTMITVSTPAAESWRQKKFDQQHQYPSQLNMPNADIFL